MNKWFCEKCDYMIETIQYGGSMQVCPYCDKIMYTLETIIQNEPDWENYPTVSC